MYGELMSRIGKKPVEIPSGVKVEAAANLIKVSGPKGNLELKCPGGIKVSVDAGKNLVNIENTNPDSRTHKALHGTIRAHISNMVFGVSKGFERKLLIYGTGYNVKQQGTKFIVQVGLCHPVEFEIPKNVKINIETPATRGNDVPAQFTVMSADKQAVGQLAADIRKVQPPEPYQGKGIRYADERVVKKVGKAFATGG